MAQQLNLLDARFAPAPPRHSARQTLLAAGLALVLGFAAAQGLQFTAGRARDQARALEVSLTPLRQQLQTLSAGGADAGAELATLQAIEAGQRRVRAALDAGMAGQRDGPASYLTALARQSTGAVWITGFSVSDDGSAIELEGRMADAPALTDYLRRLNAEPRFKGRPFSQLNLKAVDAGTAPGGGGGYTEFALRSVTPASGAAP